MQTRFGIVLDPSTLAFVYLPSRYLVDDKTWKRMTLLGQSLGSMYLAWEAMDRLIPDVFIGAFVGKLVFRQYLKPVLHFRYYGLCVHIYAHPMAELASDCSPL